MILRDLKKSQKTLHIEAICRIRPGGETSMAKYEMLYLINNDLTDEAKEAKLAKYEDVVKTMGGAVVSTDKWGTKKTAYPINFKNEAYYVLMTFEADGKVVEELKRVAGIDADVVRRLITKLG